MLGTYYHDDEDIFNDGEGSLTDEIQARMNAHERWLELEAEDARQVSSIFDKPGQG